jgi:aminopeptidase N
MSRERLFDFLEPGVSGTAQEIPPCAELDSLPRPSVPDSIDALHYTIHFTSIDMDSETIEAKTTVRLRALRSLDAVDLHFAQLQIDALTIDGVSASYGTAESTVHIPLAQPLPEGGEIDVAVTYSGSPTCSGPWNKSIVFSNRGVHTFSEPGYARHWYPCHDVPWDKATATLILDLPQEIQASATGVQQSDIVVAVDGDVFRRKTWIMSDPVATYLIAFYVGDYVEIKDRKGLVPFDYYTFPDIASATQADFVGIPDMLEFYGGFSPYPFPRYAMTIGTFPGGMEHQTNSLIGESVIRGDRSNEWLLAHELAHQWWGDYVSPSAWQHIWLNEGFATYFDLLFTEHYYGAAEFDTRLRAVQNVYFYGDSLQVERGNPRRILDLPPERIFSFLVYNKGAAILHMLRGLALIEAVPEDLFSNEELAAAKVSADEVFFSIFTEYAERHAYGNAATEDFVVVAEDVLGIDLDGFFDQWLNEPGHPRLQVAVSNLATGPGTTLNVTVTQTQENAPHFSMPLLVRYRSGEMALNEVRALEGPVTVWTANLPAGAWHVEIDPDNWLLEERVLDAVPVELLSFTAERASGGAWIAWSVADRAAAAGFHVDRSAPGEETRTRITNTLVTGTGPFEVFDTSPGAGAVDYWLEELDRTGVRHGHGPARLPASPAVALRVGAYPNPAPAAASIRFAVPVAGPVSLNVVDLHGRRMAELVRESLPAGDHTVSWNRRMTTGAEAPAGIYFLVLRSETGTAAHKLVLTP